MTDIDPILFVMNPRHIDECVASLAALDIRRAWLQNWTEWQLQDVIRDLVADPDLAFSHMILCADDVVVTQGAIDAVIAHADDHDVVTGYCRLDSGHPLVNITRRPLMGSIPSAGAYDFWSYADAAAYPDPVIPTGFVGFALTCMSRDMWTRFPFGAFGAATQSWSSDFHLSMRLRDAGVPMVAARAAYVEHVKERWNQLDTEPRKSLRIGTHPPAVVVEP